MAKPTIYTRATKGSALTWTEGDANITNLRDATITVKAGTGGIDVVSDLNGTVTLVAGTNITLSGDNTAKEITINASGGGGSIDDLTDVSLTGAATGDLLRYDGTFWTDTAASAITVGTATSADSINIASADGNASDTAMSVVLVPAQATGIQSPHVDAGLTYNASTNVLTVGVSGTVNTAQAAGSANYFMVGTSTTASGQKSLVSPTGLTYNPGTALLSVTNISGALNGTVGATTPAAGTFTTLTASSANVNVTLSPTGTGTVTISPAGALTINPTTASTINNTSIGDTTASTGRFTTITSTVATGTAPFTVASTTNVANLNASSLNGATFAAPGAIGSTTASSGKFTSLEFKNPIEPIFDLGTTGGTIAPDPANGSVQKITLNSALTINAFTNATAGETLTLFIYGGTAYTSITSTMKFAGGIKTLTATAGCIDVLTIYYDGVNYFGSLSKGFV